MTANTPTHQQQEKPPQPQPQPQPQQQQQQEEDEDDKKKEQLKERFTAVLGAAALDQGWRSTLDQSPSFFEACLQLRAVPLTKGHLPRKTQHLVALAVDSAATHLYGPGIRADIQAALAAGASLAEVVEVVELTSTLGIHACNVGMPLLVEVLREEGVYDDETHSPPAEATVAKGEPAWDPYRQRLKDEFTAKRGYWHPTWEDFLRIDPEFFEAYMAFSSVPWTKEVAGGSSQGVLEPKVKELIYCAFDAAATHLYVTGLKLHMKNALGYGATPQEIAEVLEIASLLSLHTAHTAFPLIAEAVQQQQHKR